MVSAELSVAVLVADVTLYGLMLLYYTTSTALHEQKKIWISVQRGSTADTDERWVDALASSAANNMFLLGCTLFAVPSLFLSVLSLLGMDVLGVWAVMLFLVFAFVVAVGMVGVGIQMFRLNIREARRIVGADAPLMDILNRGIGKR